ncbi:MAG TPA: STAS domain-containing protein [Thermoguttaceae bacterium]|nr:STAS domain-containing protein [Thermoguttaceae bacterium]
MLAIAPGWEVDVQRGPDWLLVKVRADSQDTGSQDTDSQDTVESDAEQLGSGIWDLMRRHFAHRLVLEMDQVGPLNSHLIGQLIHLYKRIREHDGVMRICGLSPHNLGVLRTCHLDDRFQPYHDRKEAVLGQAVSGRSHAICPR